MTDDYTNSFDTSTAKKKILDAEIAKKKNTTSHHITNKYQKLNV